MSVRMEIEKRKQDLINMEKEMIKCKDQLESKSREVIMLQELVSKYEYSGT
jgi:hypothetical protein